MSAITGVMPAIRGEVRHSATWSIVLSVLMIAFFVSRAGRTWGLDGSLADSRPKSIFTRRPFS